MSFFQTHLVSLTIFVPLLFAVLLACLPSGEKSMSRM